MNSDKSVTISGSKSRTVTKKMSKAEAYEIIDALPKKIKIKTVAPSTRKEKPEVALPFGALFLICIFTVVFLFVALLNVKVNEVSNDINRLNNELIELSEQKEEVGARLNEKNDLTLIRQLAEDEYGMVKYRDLPSRYVRVAAEDSAEVLYTEEERSISFSALLSAFSSSLYDFAEYLK